MKKEEKSPVNIKLEDSDDPQSPSKRKNTNEDCSTSQYSPYSYNNGYQGDGGGGGGGGSDRSPSSYSQQGMMVGGYHGGGGYNYPQGTTQQSTVSSTTNPYNYNNIGRTWNGAGDSNTSDPLNLRNDFHQLALEQQQQQLSSDGNLQVQMQMPVQNLMVVAPHLSKQIDMYQQQQPQPHDPNNRRLSNGSVKGLTPRRESNVSNVSGDSSYSSGTEMANGSRRDSTHSTLSCISGGRRSATCPSPMPSRNLSPGRINQTVIEGKVLDEFDQQQPSTTFGKLQQQQHSDQVVASGLVAPSLGLCC